MKDAERLTRTLDILRDLIAFPTVSTDSNLDAIHYIANLLEEAGAKVSIFRDESGNKANLFATIGPEIDGGIMLSGHSDVVPVEGQDWSRDPFDMWQEDGRVYGRGTCDMKGFIAACLALAPEWGALELFRPVHFAFTHDEEIGCLGAQALAGIMRERNPKPAIAIIGEPTSMRVIEGHKGCYEYTTRFTGLAGHGSAPDRGVNAVEYAARYVSRLIEIKDQLRARAPAGSRFDPPWTTINTGALHGGQAHNVIASEARVDWEMRPVQNTDAQFVKDNLHEYCTDTLLPAMQAVHPEANVTTETIGEVEGLIPATENEARDIVSELTGANSCDLVAFGTEAGIFQSLGMSAVVCGPGSIEQAHKPDEFIEITQLQHCLGMLDRLGTKLIR